MEIEHEFACAAIYVLDANSLHGAVGITSGRGMRKTGVVSYLDGGIWFEPINALLTRNPNRIWTTRHAAEARLRVINGGWTVKRLYGNEEERNNMPDIVRSHERKAKSPKGD